MFVIIIIVVDVYYDRIYLHSIIRLSNINISSMEYIIWQLIQNHTNRRAIMHQYNITHTHLEIIRARRQSMAINKVLDTGQYALYI